MFEDFTEDEEIKDEREVYFDSTHENIWELKYAASNWKKKEVI